MAWDGFSAAGTLERPRAATLVFDIETLPDIPLLMKAQGVESSEGKSPEDHWNDLDMFKRVAQKAGKEFFPPLYHSVLCICAVFLDPDTQQIIDGFRSVIPVCHSYQQFQSEEKKLLMRFWDFCNKYKDSHKVWYDKTCNEGRLSSYERRRLRPIPLVFCGYNIMGFDLPVLEQRSMKHLLQCPVEGYGEVGNDSYRSRYALDKSYDLMAWVSNHSPGQRTGLDALSIAMGFGGKMEGMEGSQVAPTYFVKGDVTRILDYCAVDVLVTYGVYMGVQRFRGLLDLEQFQDCARQFRRFLLSENRPEPYRALAHSSAEFFANALGECTDSAGEIPHEATGLS